MALLDEAGAESDPEARIGLLIEVETLQRLRLRYQLLQIREGIRPSDVLVLDRLSAIDRTVIAQAVREVSSIQRRMANVSNYVPTADWSSSEGL